MYLSALLWAQSNPNSFNTVTWQQTRTHFYDALTSTSQEEIENSFAKTFKNLGQLMHLVSDMAVPAHVRNDAHPEVMLWDWMGATHFEIYTKNHFNDLKYENAPKPNPELFNLAKPHDYAPSPISALFDINEYNENEANPERTREPLIGLAEYTNANFFSEDTIFTGYQYPAKTETNYYDPSLQPREVWAEDGKRETVRYLVKNDGLNEPIAALSYFYINTDHTNPLGAIDIILDDEVYKSYAGKLVPKAVGYSSALLDYFFRGKMQVTALPTFFNDNMYAIRLNIKNTTPSFESMTNGNFSLVVRYTPADGNANGSDDEFYQTYDVESGEIQYNDERNKVSFYLKEDLSKVKYETGSFKCMLVFKGELGKEKNAVIGKSFTLGEIKFNEEWTSGMDGENHPKWTWSHMLPEDNPDIRYVEFDNARVNKSYINLTSNLEFPNGILITPETYLQFKIDESSINVQPPAPPDKTSAWQILHLKFNNGLHLQYYSEGQGVDFPEIDKEAFYTFTLGNIVIDNIHTLFQYYGLEIPDPFYLESINFDQTLWYLDEPSTEEHRQHMEVDCIRIIEGTVSQ